MQTINQFLKDGVHLHPFRDHSGVVFFNDNSTQMLTVYLAIDSLNELCAKFYSKDLANDLADDELSLLRALQRQDFLHEH